MSGQSRPIPMTSHKSGPLLGQADVSGDKSISHRSLILGALSVGETKIQGLLEGDDVLDTGKAMRAFGAEVVNHGAGSWSVHGVGVGGFAEPDHVIDCGNSGTSVRLIIGAMSTTGINATFTGDDSLNKRPMDRITDPLALFGTQAHGRSHGRLPLTIVGASNPVPVRYIVPMPSAQVKSAVLLAGLNAPGQTVVIEKEATRDHTERMLAGFGAKVQVEETAEGRMVTLTGQPELNAQSITVPRDPSSAAFPVCAALIVEGSNILVPNIGLNPTRAGLFYTLQDMGADLTFENMREEGGEPVADLRAKYSSNLKGIAVPPERAASMIDEYPILAIVASFAAGVTRMHGVKELRVKESDRIEAMATGLRAAGVTVDEGPDWWHVHGLQGQVHGGTSVATHLDHRIAMSFLILGMATQNPVSIDDGAPVATSFPIFETLMADLGASLVRDAV
ncbi:MAG: 3-phosphoshikimate 1-carboxyvinyltransferase, partial [Planktomarina sp.]|nr:3-phosphoshikimate 1-carboxyvinyltransferase [Planktomarina sp.]